ncbi:signal recognition particle-docking protein FtsY [Lapillicoccus sp.]|uniref:signal recognition particle-docking protein FtsY n=1 Tax=Lapillicoccus sp. TaxID=1909287 RepID=UPI0032656079
MGAVVDQVWEVVAVAVLVLLALGAVVLGLVRGRAGRGGRGGRRETLTPPPKTAPTRPIAPPTDVDADRDTGLDDSVGTIETSGTTAPPEAEVADTLVEEPTAPAVEKPESARGRLARLRARLARSNTAIGNALLQLLSRGDLDEQAWEDVEDTLISSDLGVEASTELVGRLRVKVKVDGSGSTDEATVRGWLKEDLLELVDPGMDRRIASSRVDGRPSVILVVGVNGTGKTTTVGKLARVLVAEDRDVVLGAADTFRAAAADQLETWGDRVGVPTIRSDRDGADPAAVAFDAVKAGAEIEADVVIIDTAGRLHNKVGLMDELSKIKRVIEKLQPIDEVLLVLDATTGQNGLRQAEVFSEAVKVTGIVLTKLDGSAKGGIVVAVQRQLGVPVKLVGLGEGPDDLAPFDPEAFVDAIVG